jgi:alpha-glucosidase (family GH31 glycosyl hydrolase)
LICGQSATRTGWGDRTKPGKPLGYVDRSVLFRMLRPGHLLFLGLAWLVYSAPALADLGDYSGHELVPSGLRVEAGDDTLLLELYAPDIVRLDLRPLDSAPPGTSLVVVRGPDPGVEFQVRDTGPAIELLTSDIIVSMEKSPIRFSFFDHLGWDLVAEPEGGGLEVAGTLTRARFMLHPDLHLYGTGERGVGIDMRGHSFGTYNQQVYGYDGPLEAMKINVPFLATSGGFALYFDNAEPGGFDLGHGDSDVFLYQRSSRGLTYFLMAAPSVAEQIERYTWLTGRQPLPPKWALGYLQSKYGYRTRGEAETMVRTMRARGIPADGIILDLYWFDNMGDLEWNIDVFPNPQGMVADFLSRGFKTILITEPYFNEFSQYYRELTGPLGDFVGRNWLGEPYLLDGWWSCNCDAVLLDITNPGARQWLWDRYEDMLRSNIAGFWTDLGEPERHPWDMEHYMGSALDVHNVYNLLWAETIYEGSLRYRPNGRVFNLTRSGYAGIQRYGVFTWSGDVSRSYGGLQVQVPIMLNTSLSGLAYHSSDLGGFTGWSSPELYVRWMQFGAFNPVMRAHGVDNQGTEPWSRGQEAEAIVTEFIRLRYRLLPYLYSLAWENHRTGMPLVRPLFFHDPGDPGLADNSDSFLLGPDILVAPVTADGVRSRQVYLPEGYWVDFWTDSLHTGPQSISAEAPLERIPVFIRGGAILPMQPVVDHVGESPPDTLILHVYPAPESEREIFTLYEDDGVSRAYETGELSLTPVASEVVQGDTDTTLHVDIGSAAGGFSDMPQTRTILTVIHLAGREPRWVGRDSLSLAPRFSEADLMDGEEGYYYDPVSHILRIKTEHRTYHPTSLEVGGWRIRGGEGDDKAPLPIGLGPVRPNPFGAGTRIPYRIADGARVTVDVFSLGGRKVVSLVNDVKPPGSHTVFWDGRDSLGKPTAPGVYFCRFASGDLTDVDKLVLIR